MNIQKTTIGIIGLGNMGGAIGTGLSRIIDPKNIIGYDISSQAMTSLTSSLSISTASSIQELSHKSDVIIIAVKPAIVASVASELKSTTKNKLIISIAAGITLQKLSEWLGDSFRIIRCMPNMPALVGEGMTVLSTTSADNDDIEIAQQIFGALGKVMVVSEQLMDAVTAVSGSGPAYVFTLIQAMADAGVKSGLARDSAVTLAAQTVLGSAKMVLQGQEPIVLRGKVASPAGTTIDAIHVLEKHGFSGIIMDAIEAAFLKSRTLGGK